MKEREEGEKPSIEPTGPAEAASEASEAAEATPGPDAVPAETAAAAEPAAPPAGPTLDQGIAALEEKVATLDKEKRETYDRLLRTTADFDNFRKRSRKDAEDARARSREEVLKEMLPIVDNLERAIGALKGGEGGSLFEGVKLVLRQALTAFERFEVRPFDSVGQPFDPARHEAITQVETADRPAGTVHFEMQRGYTIGDRLLRPAMVGVAKAPAAPPPQPEAPADGEGGERSSPPAAQGPDRDDASEADDDRGP